MKQSYYTFTFAIGTDILLYNAMSGALAKLPKEAWEARETDVSVSDALKEQGFLLTKTWTNWHCANSSIIKACSPTRTSW